MLTLLLSLFTVGLATNNYELVANSKRCNAVSGAANMLEQIFDLSSPSECAVHCENTNGCLFFTYFTSDGHCNLCDTNAGMYSGGDTYVLPNVLPIDYELVASGKRCNAVSGAANMLEQIFDLSSPTECAVHCENTDGCVYFTYFTRNGHCNLCDTNAGKGSSGDTYVWQRGIIVSGMCEIPQGDFLTSCTQCRLENCVLECNCGVGISQLDLTRQCSGKSVRNLGGALSCPITVDDGLDAYIPEGEVDELLSMQGECTSLSAMSLNIQQSECPRKSRDIFSETSIDTESEFNGFLWSFGQFVDHDLDLVREDKNLKVHIGAEEFELAESECALGPNGEAMVGQRRNAITSVLDLSNVYDETIISEIRDANKPAYLRWENEALPLNSENEFICGDVRCGENPFLMAQHHLWAKHHNVIVDEIQHQLPSDATEDEIYELAKQINVGTYQRVVMDEFVPTLVGEFEAHEQHQPHTPSLTPIGQNQRCESGFWLTLDDRVSRELCMQLIESLSYSGTCKAGVMSHSDDGRCFCALESDTHASCQLSSDNGVSTYTIGPQHDVSINPLFAGAAYRLHQLVQDTFELTPGDSASTSTLSEHFFKTESFMNNGKMDGWLERLFATNSNRFGSHMSHSLQHALFCTDGENCKDLAALNCMRGVDMELPTLNEAREQYGLQPHYDFDELDSNCPELSQIYEDINDVELFTGGSCEFPVDGAVLGETFLKIVKDQFLRLRDGDPNFGKAHPIPGQTYRDLRGVLQTVTGVDATYFHESNIFQSK